MNVADTEVVVSILKEKGYQLTSSMDHADVILVNTCSVRENAEQRIRGRLQVFNMKKKENPALLIGLIGCMAERLKEQLLEQEKMLDMVVGPDAYRSLPGLIEEAGLGQKAVNVILSADETYADINPVRTGSNGISAFISIMRGCENMCAYCIVPYTRGVERSRDAESIIWESTELNARGFKEITLIGQNVDSYHYKDQKGVVTGFAGLLEKVAQAVPAVRIRFATSHPKDMTDEVLRIMAEFPNICKSIHLPVQSGSTAMLQKMNRGYKREWYLDRISAIKRIVPECAVSTDIMVGFSGETEEDHRHTLDLMKQAEFDYAFMFKYSERPGTYAAEHYPDDVPEDIKLRRLSEVIALQNKLSEQSKKEDLGKTYEVLVEGVSKKSPDDHFGRNSQNKVVVFPKGKSKPGDLVNVRIHRYTSATLIGKII